MAEIRWLHTSFWGDSFVLDLTPEEKLIYIYLLTNARTRQCGAYEIPPKAIEYETGLIREVVARVLERFQAAGKILFDKTTNEVLILNWFRHNDPGSPKIKARAVKDTKTIRSKFIFEKLKELMAEHGYCDELLQSKGVSEKPIDSLSENSESLSEAYGKPIDTLSPHARAEKEKEKEKEKDLKDFAPSDFSASEKSSKPEAGDSPLEDNSSGPSKQSAISTPHQRIQMDRTTLRWKGILQEDIERWKDAYPAVDVEQQLRKMEIWASANQSKWKSNWLRFIFHWLSKEQDRGGSSWPGPAQAPREPPKTFEQVKAERTHDAARKALDEFYGPKDVEVCDGTISI
jgi:hypothetical protein